MRKDKGTCRTHQRRVKPPALQPSRIQIFKPSLTPRASQSSVTALLPQPAGTTSDLSPRTAPIAARTTSSSPPPSSPSLRGPASGFWRISSAEIVGGRVCASARTRRCDVSLVRLGSTPPPLEYHLTVLKFLTSIGSRHSRWTDSSAREAWGLRLRASTTRPKPRWLEMKVRCLRCSLREQMASFTTSGRARVSERDSMMVRWEREWGGRRSP